MFCKCKLTNAFEIKLKLIQINTACSGCTIVLFKHFQE